MATREEMLTALRNADAAGDAEAATRIAGMLSSAPSTPAQSSAVGRTAPYQPYQNETDIGSDTERFGENPGTGKGGAEFHQGIASTPARLVKSIAQMMGQDHRLPEVVNKSAQVADTGFGTAGRVVGDIAATALPAAGVARGVQMVKPLAAPGFLPAAGRVAVSAAENAGYGALLSPDDQANAALWGAGGGAVGHALTRTMKGLVKPTDAAQELASRGVALTPGQAAGAGTVINKAEQWLASNPIAGTPIRASQRRALQESNVAAAQSVANLVDDKIKLGLPPAEAIEQTRAAIGRSYDEALADMTVPTDVLRQDLIAHLPTIAAENPMMTKAAFQHMRQYVEGRLNHIWEQGIEHMNGAMLKQADSEIGQFIRNLSTATNAADKTAVPAWRELQTALREAMAVGAKSPEQYQQLQNANAAYRQLLAVEKARLSGAEHFTPRQLARQVENAELQGSDLGKVSQAMNQTLPNTVPDSGTVERALANGLPALLLGGGAGAQAMGWDTVGAGLMGAGALGSRTGARLMTGNYGWQPLAAASVRALRRGVPAATRKQDE